MRMTLHTDYALRMLIYLAVHSDRTSTVNDIAESYGISRNHLLKVTLTLRKLGLVSTARGRSGGVRLARAPAEINVGTVVRAMGDGFPVVACMADGEGCVLTPECKLRNVVRAAVGAYLSVFDSYSLADLVHNGDVLRTILDLSAVSNAQGTVAA